MVSFMERSVTLQRLLDLYESVYLQFLDYLSKELSSTFKIVKCCNQTYTECYHQHFFGDFKEYIVQEGKFYETDLPYLVSKR